MRRLRWRGLETGSRQSYTGTKLETADTAKGSLRGTAPVLDPTIPSRCARPSVADATIGIDPNEGWTVSETIRAMREVAPHRPDYLEQPVRRQNIAGMAAIRKEIAGVPLMVADEGVMTLADAYALAKADTVDAFCIKLYKMGGLRAAKKIGAVAEASGIQLNIGGLAVLSQLEAAAGAHFYASSPERHVMPAADSSSGSAWRDPIRWCRVPISSSRTDTSRRPPGPGWAFRWTSVPWSAIH